MTRRRCREKPNPEGLRSWLKVRARPGGDSLHRRALGDNRDVHKAGERFGVSGETVRSLLRAEGWEKKPYGVTGRPFWYPPR